jgi:hypothetical protein
MVVRARVNVKLFSEVEMRATVNWASLTILIML